MSHGLIRLKKVKVAPKRNLSIIKTSVYKKQLSVRFEDQMPIATIKNLSQDIDQISQVIDTYFPIKSSDAHTPLVPLLQDSKVPSYRTSDISTATLSSSFDSNQCFYCKHNLQNPWSKIGLHQNTFEKILEGKSFSGPEGSTDGQEGGRKYRNMAPAETYGYDFRVVKKGRNFRVGSVSVGCKDVNENLDLITPKIVKQTAPLKRIQKNRKRGGKDIIIAA